jgi:hypothetical protein
VTVYVNLVQLLRGQFDEKPTIHPRGQRTIASVSPATRELTRYLCAARSSDGDRGAQHRSEPGCRMFMFPQVCRRVTRNHGLEGLFSWI